MSAGMRIWGATGVLELDETSFTVQVTYSATVTFTPGTRSRFIPIAGVTPATHSAIVIPIGAYPQDPFGQDAYASQYMPTVGNGGVTVYFGNPNTASGPIGLSTQRLLVMKFR